DGAESDADRNRPLAAEDLAHLVGRGRRRKIPVEVRMTKQRVADGTTDAPRLEPRVLQTLGNIEHDRWRIQAWHGEQSSAQKMASHYNLDVRMVILPCRRSCVLGL